MGAVWLAQHTGLDTPCAVKFIHEEAAHSHELRGRFEREAKAAAQLRSPHVVQIFDHGVWEGIPYIAMELLEGEDLARRLRKRRGPLEAREVAAIAAQVGRALTKAHAAGLIHRDLKPANIFLVRDDDREIAKVLDFGVAKTTALSSMGTDGDTKTGAILGTPSYMSPEQARGNKDVDHRADLWALSVVIYQCMTGKLPFRSDALGDLLVKIIVEPLPIPSEVASVPLGFDAWWARAAHRDPAQRFQTAKELAEALTLALDVSQPSLSEVGSSVAIPVPRGPFPSLTGGAASSRVPAAAQDAVPTVSARPITVDPPASQTAVPTMLTPAPQSATSPATPIPVTPPSTRLPAPAPGHRSGASRALLAGLGVVIVGGGAFVALRSGPPAAGSVGVAPVSPAAGSVSAAPSVTASPLSPAPSVTASASPSASASAALPLVPASAPSVSPRVASPRAATSAGSPRSAPPAPAVAKPRTDFGI